MDLTHVDAKNMKSLEDYAVCLVMGLLSLKTLETYQARVMQLGILKEDQECRTNTILWDLHRMMKMYQDQADSVLELLPDDINPQTIIQSMQAKAVAKAKQTIKEAKEKGK